MDRNIYKQLVDWKENKRRKPLILRGARQVGKTYALKHFGKKHFSNCHYVNLEEQVSLHRIFDKDLNPQSIVSELEFHLGSSIDVKHDVLIIDEIQACGRALTSLKYFCEDMPELAVCAAGSLLGLMLVEYSFPVGKVDYLDLLPLTFEEFLAGTEEKQLLSVVLNIAAQDSIPLIAHEQLWQKFIFFLIVGGLPEAVSVYRESRPGSREAFSKARTVQQNIIKSHIVDMAKHAGKQNSMHLQRLWENIPAQLSRTQDGSAPKFRFKGVISSAHTYSRLAGTLDWLETAGLVIRVQIVNSGESPLKAYTEENRFKLFCYDVGILGALSNIDPMNILSYDYGRYKGFYAENFVAQELHAAGFQNLFSWQERRAEVEFLVEHEGNVLPIEVKSGWVTRAKSLSIFAEKYNPFFRTIISAKELRIGSKLHQIPLYLTARFPFDGAKSL